MTIQQAVIKYKLDKRHNWFSFCNTVTRNEWVTHYCTGCTETYEYKNSPQEGAGCHECGYKGKVRNGYPVAALDAHNNPIRVTDKDFTYFKKSKK